MRVARAMAMVMRLAGDEEAMATTARAMVTATMVAGERCSAHRLCVDLVMGNHTCDMVCTLLLPY